MIMHASRRSEAGNGGGKRCAVRRQKNWVLRRWLNTSDIQQLRSTSCKLGAETQPRPQKKLRGKSEAVSCSFFLGGQPAGFRKLRGPYPAHRYPPPTLPTYQSTYGEVDSRIRCGASLVSA